MGDLCLALKVLGLSGFFAAIFLIDRIFVPSVPSLHLLYRLLPAHEALFFAKEHRLDLSPHLLLQSEILNELLLPKSHAQPCLPLQIQALLLHGPPQQLAQLQRIQHRKDRPILLPGDGEMGHFLGHLSGDRCAVSKILEVGLVDALLQTDGLGYPLLQLCDLVLGVPDLHLHPLQLVRQHLLVQDLVPYSL